MSTGVIDLGLTVSSIPSGAAGGDLSGNYPDPDVATVGGSAAADIHTAELLANAATAANTASAIVKRDSSGNAALNLIKVGDGAVGAPSLVFSSDLDTGIYRIGANDLGVAAGGHLGFEVKDNGTYANIGMGSAPSASSQYIILSQRSFAGPIHWQLANPDTGAGSGTKIQMSSSSGNNGAEIGLFSPATTAPDAYDGGQMTIRSTGTTTGISLVADDVVTAKVKIYAGGNASTNKVAQFNADLSMHSYGGVILATTGSKPSAGSAYRGMFWVTQGGAGVPDQVEMCMKKTDDTYAWVVVKAAP